jgi:hypothetical protein
MNGLMKRKNVVSGVIENNYFIEKYNERGNPHIWGVVSWIEHGHPKRGTEGTFYE